MTQGSLAKIRARLRHVLARAIVFLLLFCVVGPMQVSGYAVLAHEAIIDAAWDTDIRPLLLKRFPNATREQLKEAHGYAYGGAIIQDMGYYPHGSFLFSDLTHYVRSGDFVAALLRDAQDLDGYAFALGSLAHYAADNEGHGIGVNPSVPILYPKLQKKYGSWVTYEQNPLDHLKTEFGFDVIEVAEQHYAPDSYHDFIGFGVEAPLLEQAFRETYGLDLKQILDNENKALGSYRYDVSRLLPKATRIAWTLKQDQIKTDRPGITKREFLYNLSRASYQRNWGHDYQGPTLGEKILAFLTKIIPKVGPLRAFQLRVPTPATERMFEASFNATLNRYRELLADLDAGRLNLPNTNFDTGSASKPGDYRLNDETHAKLIDRLARQDFQGASPEVRAELLEFYANPDDADTMKKNEKEWEKIEAEVDQLKKQSPSVSPAAAQ